jgi:hypothetical protein
MKRQELIERITKHNAYVCQAIRYNNRQDVAYVEIDREDLLKTLEMYPNMDDIDCIVMSLIGEDNSDWTIWFEND